MFGTKPSEPPRDPDYRFRIMEEITLPEPNFEWV
jgi:hypothetical protein